MVMAILVVVGWEKKMVTAEEDTAMAEASSSSTSGCGFCGEAYGYGSCRNHQCECRAGVYGVDCAYTNYSDTSGLLGFTCLETKASTNQDYLSVVYQTIAQPPYEDCEGMRVTIRSTGPDGLPDSGDDGLLADFIVELKALGADQVGQYCLPFTRDHYLSQQCRLCLDIVDGQLVGTEDDPQYIGNTIAHLDCLGSNVAFYLGPIDYRPPDRCSSSSCLIDYDDDLSAAQWTAVSIHSSSRPYIATTRVAKTTGRYVFRFKELPPPSLTMTFALQCQPTPTRYTDVNEQYDSKDWTLFDSCGVVYTDTIVYFAFHCALPPCNFHISSIISEVQQLSPDETLSVTGSEVALFHSTVPMRSYDGYADYNFVLNAFYRDQLVHSTQAGPWLQIRARNSYCPLPTAPANASRPDTWVDAYEALTQLPAPNASNAIFRPGYTYYFRVEVPQTVCDLPAYSYSCSSLVYSVSLEKRPDPDDGGDGEDDSDDHTHSSSHPFLTIVLPIIISVLIAAGVVLAFIKWRQHNNSSPQAQGFQFFPSNTDFLEESEVDEVVVADESPADSNNSFKIAPNSFSL